MLVCVAISSISTGIEQILLIKIDFNVFRLLELLLSVAIWRFSNLTWTLTNYFFRSFNQFDFFFILDRYRIKLRTIRFILKCNSWWEKKLGLEVYVNYQIVVWLIDDYE